MTKEITIDVLDAGYAATADGKRFGYTTLDDLLNGLRGLLSEQQLGLDFGAGDERHVTGVLDDDGWREWDGELRPGQVYPAGLNRDTPVQAVLRNGNQYPTCHAWTLRWHWSTASDHNPMLDIVRYRVVRP